MVPKLRVARPTSDLAPLVRFYCNGLGLTELSSFTNHDGFDGVILGHPHAPYHLEFTVQQGHLLVSFPTPEHLLVFYIPEHSQWLSAVERMQAHGYDPVVASNPYWDRLGRTYEDPDGYRVVLQNAAWEY
ncbi:VOC family protein [Hymenobacter fodinae]|uniref:VOC family protein n=1 Tax=Hymenobacter fodinae TaxID=2510796 RepID=A0A4Z0P2T9_9BACT|nr:VOC family protein [Hymenobacter fodinae]TGE05288.1 VOC family protein [Hymenobacter fodinae]